MLFDLTFDSPNPLSRVLGLLGPSVILYFVAWGKKVPRISTRLGRIKCSLGKPELI